LRAGRAFLEWREMGSAVSASPWKLLLVEDEGVLRQLLGDTLQRHFPEAEVLACRSGSEGVAQARKGRPRLAVLDFGLPDLSGLEVARAVREVSPRTILLLLTARVPDVPVGDLIAAGVTGLVDKAMPKEQLLAAVECVLAGGFYLVAQQAPAGLPTGGGAPAVRPDVLTADEREVARLLAAGLSTKEVAARTETPVRTVEKKRLRVMQKLRIHTLAALVRWCLRNGVE
jgi:DNA-binding NarL/FixJ family response regulator